MDLLEHYHLLPVKVQTVLLKFRFEDDWGECIRVINELEKLGYTAEYDMCGELYDLVSIELIELPEVGSLLDKKTNIVYPQLKNGLPDIDSGILLSECSDEFLNKITTKF